MPSTSPGSVIGYHGTNQIHLYSIQRNNFWVGENRDGRYLGQGAYFFVEGVASKPPERLAADWGNFDGRRKGYRQWVVIKAEADMSKMLDLTDSRQMRMFNILREDLGPSVKPTVAEQRKHCGIDVAIIEILKERQPIACIRANVYSTFQGNNIASHLPNVTILCVCEPDEAIPKASIRQHSTGVVR